jgi:hypothetical protein
MIGIKLLGGQSRHRQKTDKKSIWVQEKKMQGGLMTQNGRTKFDHYYSQNTKISVVKMVNPNYIMTISTIPDFLVVEFVEIVEISVNFDHLTMTI